MAADIPAWQPGMGWRATQQQATPPVPIGGGRLPPSALAQASDFVKLSRSADTLGHLAAAGSPPAVSLPVARSSFDAPFQRQQHGEPEVLKSVQRKLVGDASLFFDILGEGDCGVRDAKMKRVASDQRLKDLAMASSASLASSDAPPGQLGGSSGNLAALASGSAGHLSNAADSHAEVEMRFEDDLRDSDAPLQDADASKLLRDLCGDMYVDAAQLDNFEPLGQGAFATVQKCRLRRPNSSAVPPERASPGSRPSLALGRTPSFRKPSASRSRQGGSAPGELVAVKQLKPAVLGNETELHGFIAETDVLRRLRHPAIVEFKGVGAMRSGSAESMRRSMFLVQELMAGGTLKALLVDAYYSTHDRRLFSRQDALRWTLQIAEALAYLHQFSPLIVHRDLKLENILLTSPNPARADAKLADFGLHKMIKDVASGVRMVQSTEEMQVVLKDMGFEQTTPREVQQSRVSDNFRQSTDDARPFSDLTPGSPLVPAAAQRQQEAAVHCDGSGDGDSAHTAPQPTAGQSYADAGRQGPEPPSALQPAGGPAASALEPAYGIAGLHARGEAQQTHQSRNEAAPPVRPELLAAVMESGAPQPPVQLPPPQPLQPPLPPPQQSPQQGQEPRSWRRWSESSARDVTRQQADRLQPLSASPFQAPAAAASFQPAALRAAANSAQHLAAKPAQQTVATVPQQSAAGALPLQPLGSMDALPAATSPLQREDSAKLMGELALEQDAVLEGAVARRSNSGPLSRTMLRAAMMPAAAAPGAPPSLATKSMGILGRGEENGAAAQLPPLPRGSGVAQRLRSIRMVSRELDAGKEGSAPVQQAAVNAVVAARLRESRASNAGSPAAGDSAVGGSAGGGSRPAGHSSTHGSVKALLALVGARKSMRRGSVGSSTDDSPRITAQASPVSATRRSHMMSQLKKVSLAKASCGYSTDTTGGPDADASVHLEQANMAYRMTGQTGSLCYMAPEVLRGTFYNEKVDVFSLGVVMWELLSYTPTIAIVSGEDMVDRVFQYAERVAGGFRQPLPGDWPPEVRALIADCWQSNPIARPSAAKVAKRLKAMMEAGVARRWDEQDARVRREAAADRRRRAGPCGCFAGRRQSNTEEHWRVS